MTIIGLDVGSRTTSRVTIRGGVFESAVVDTGVRPLEQCRRLIGGQGYRRLVVTGYGRHLVATALGGEVVSEITAHAIGAGHLYPDCRTVIDIGGQDSKVIALSDSGNVRKFEMNDRCAAGTGRFLEVMAETLETNIRELGGLALSAGGAAAISSLCTIFAESEVVSLIARGEDPGTIALGLHEAIATRLAGMVRRVGPKERVVFVGGTALNRCLRELLAQRLDVQLTVPPEPQTVGALGAALLAGQLAAK